MSKEEDGNIDECPFSPDNNTNQRDNEETANHPESNITHTTVQSERTHDNGVDLSADNV